MQPSLTPSSASSETDLWIRPSRHRFIAVVVLSSLLLSGPLLLAYKSRPAAALLALLLVLFLCSDLLRQPWLNGRLTWRAGGWRWSTDGKMEQTRVEVVRTILTSPLATCIHLSDPVSGHRWWLNLFHDSLSRESLSALRRRLIVDG